MHPLSCAATIENGGARTSAYVVASTPRSSHSDRSGETASGVCGRLTACRPSAPRGEARTHNAQREQAAPRAEAFTASVELAVFTTRNVTAVPLTLRCTEVVNGLSSLAHDAFGAASVASVRYFTALPCS